MSGRYPGLDLDTHTADRLLALDGTAVTPELAPLARVLWAAAAVAELDQRAGEERALAAFRAAMAADRSAASWRRPNPPRRSAPARVAAFVVGLSVVLCGAIGAAAATGYLPEPAQRAARELLERVGIHLPEPAHASDKQPVEPVPAEPDPADAAEPHPAEPDPTAPAPGDLPDTPTTDDVDAGSDGQGADDAALLDASAGASAQTQEELSDGSSTTSEAPGSPAPTAPATPPAPSKPAAPPAPPKPATPTPPEPAAPPSPPPGLANASDKASADSPPSAANSSAWSDQRPTSADTAPQSPTLSG